MSDIPDDLAGLRTTPAQRAEILAATDGDGWFRDLISDVERLTSARDEAVAERDRLRAALEEIASRGCWAEGDIWSCEVAARDALALPLPVAPVSEG